MSSSLTPRIAMLSALYVILLIILTGLFNLGVDWVLNNVVLSLMDWFNRLGLIWKFILLFFGGTIFIGAVLAITKMVGAAIIIVVYNKLPENMFTFVSSCILYLLNVGFSIYALWNIVPGFNLFTVLEFIFLIIFILSVNTVLLPWRIKDQIAKNATPAY